MMMDESMVLVITPSPYMTNKIQKALDDIGGYNVITSSSPAVALQIAQKSIICICILDVFHPEFPVVAVVKELKHYRPDMKLILVLSDPSFKHEAIPQVIPNGLLPRSFNFEQFKAALGIPPRELNLVNHSGVPLDQSLQVSAIEQAYSNFPYDPQHFIRSSEFTNIHQRLSNLSAITTSLAIILIRRKRLLSYRSRLPFPVIQEIVELINRHSITSSQNLAKEIKSDLHKFGSGDIIRFEQLQSIQGKVLLHLLSLTREILLAVIYEPDTHFIDIRKQSTELQQELRGTQQSLLQLNQRSDSRIYESVQLQSHQATQAQPVSDMPLNQQTPLKTGVQPDSTVKIPIDSELTNHQLQVPENEEIITISSTPSVLIDADTGVERIDSIPGTLDNEVGYHEEFELDEQTTGVPKEPKQMDQGYPSTRTKPVTSDSPVRPNRSYITYSCMLIPRMPQHLLDSNLAASLFKWTGQLCLAYGWRLEHLSIHPNHIQLIAGAPITTSPAFLIRTMRQKTSQHIFTQFPPLTSENPSGDFWAPGFFIAGGKQTIQPRLIDQYISEIRENQGVNNSIEF